MDGAVLEFINSIYEFIEILIQALEKLIPLLEKYMVESDFYYELDLLLEILKKLGGVI